MIANDAMRAADELLTVLPQYHEHRDYLIQQINDRFWNGDWDIIIEFEDQRDLRFIQEDEYDQSMSDDEKPDWDDQVAFVFGYYVFFE